MSVAKVGKWGSNLAVRIPLEVAAATGLTVGEGVEIEARDSEIVIRRADAGRRARADALAAMQEILSERDRYSLAGLDIGELIEEGRR
jgi:antitoxin component of MazEF toxin-antitoxin module